MICPESSRSLPGFISFSFRSSAPNCLRTRRLLLRRSYRFLIPLALYYSLSIRIEYGIDTLGHTTKRFSREVLVFRHNCLFSLSPRTCFHQSLLHQISSVFFSLMTSSLVKAKKGHLMIWSLMKLNNSALSSTDPPLKGDIIELSEVLVCGTISHRLHALLCHVSLSLWICSRWSPTSQRRLSSACNLVTETREHTRHLHLEMCLA